MDIWSALALGFVVGFLCGLRFWWGERGRRIAAERLLRTPLGQLAVKGRR